jgi:hypothetical protein
MNPIDGQLLLALACVAVAAAVLVRRFVLLVKDPKGNGCGSGGCSRCPTNRPNTADGFVSLNELSNK